MTSKLQTTLQKLQALADRGIGGEEVNARAQLDRLMRKHGISPGDLEGDTMVRVRLSYAGLAERRLAHQTAFVLIDRAGAEYSGYYVAAGGETTWREYKVPAGLAIELDATWEAYKRAFRAEAKTLALAFMNKHDLFVATETSDEATEEQIAEWRKAAAMAEGVDRVEFHKQIENGDG